MSPGTGRRHTPAWLIGYTLTVLGGSAYTLRLLGGTPERTPIRRGVAEGPEGGPPSPPPGGLAQWPRVTIIVPARNEERNLPQLLPSLLTQAYPADRYRVIVVDDGSTDRTPAILAAFARDYPHLQVLTGAPLPEGWKGKPWAMQQGAAAADGEWLLFTDADTVHTPASLSSTVADAVEQEIDLYTITPCLVLGGPAERLIMPVVSLGIFTFYNPRAVNDPRKAAAIANGQFLLFRRTLWDALGGMERVHADIAEDLEMGRLVKRAGYRLRLVDGRDLVRVRMYHNWAEVWEGWRKNVLLSFKKQPGFGALQMGALLNGLLPFGLFGLYAARAAHRGTPADRTAAVLTGAQVLALFAVKRRVDQMLEIPPGWTLTFPFGMLIFLAILLDSFRRLLSGEGVTWKGRAYTK